MPAYDDDDFPTDILVLTIGDTGAVPTNDELETIRKQVEEVSHLPTVVLPMGVNIARLSLVGDD